MKWLIFVLMLPHLKPECLQYLWPSVEQLFDIGRMVSALLILFLYILKKRLPSKPVWILALLQGWILVSTYMNRGNLWASFLTMASILSVASIIDFFAVKPKELLAGLLPCFELMIYANLASVFLYYPAGMYISAKSHYRCYFLGYHNGFILYVLPAVVIAFLYISMTGKKGRPIFTISAGIASICITWSATSICGLLAFVGVILVSKSRVNQRITYPVIFGFTMLVNLLVSVFRIMDRALWMAYFIESFLKKQISLTGRIYIWDEFYNLFPKSPWVGYGSGVDISTRIGVMSHMHNQWFQYLFQGGIPACMLFLALNFAVGKWLTKHHNTLITNVFLAAFAALYVLFIAEAYVNPVLYMVFFLAYNIEKFEVGPTPEVRRAHLTKGGHHVPNRKLPEKH